MSLSRTPARPRRQPLAPSYPRLLGIVALCSAACGNSVVDRTDDDPAEAAATGSGAGAAGGDYWGGPDGVGGQPFGGYGGTAGAGGQGAGGVGAVGGAGATGGTGAGGWGGGLDGDAAEVFGGAGGT